MGATLGEPFVLPYVTTSCQEVSGMQFQLFHLNVTLEDSLCNEKNLLVFSLKAFLHFILVYQACKAQGEILQEESETPRKGKHCLEFCSLVREKSTKITMLYDHDKCYYHHLL